MAPERTMFGGILGDGEGGQLKTWGRAGGTVSSGKVRLMSTASVPAHHPPARHCRYCTWDCCVWAAGPAACVKVAEAGARAHEGAALSSWLPVAAPTSASLLAHASLVP